MSESFFLTQKEGFYFFDRTVFPFAYTIPAGHLDVGETPLQAVQRELLEETGLVASSIELVSTEELVGDECSRGADIHLWHLYKGKIAKIGEEQIDAHEGGNPAWFTPSEAKENNLTFPAHHFIDKYGDKLL